jgi:molecular chaperone DnaK
MSEGGTARLRSATENIERALHNVAEVLYKAGQAAGAAQAGAAGAGAGAGAPGGSSAGGSQQQKKPDDVIDAEYVDVDESKRPN